MALVVLMQGFVFFPHQNTYLDKKKIYDKKREAYQVVLQRVRPDVILDHFSQLISSCIRMVCEPGEEALWLLMLPFLPSFVWTLACTLRQVLGRKIVSILLSVY